MHKKIFWHFWAKNNLLLFTWRATCPFDPLKILFRGLFYKVSLKQYLVISDPIQVGLNSLITITWNTCTGYMKSDSQEYKRRHIHNSVFLVGLLLKDDWTKVKQRWVGTSVKSDVRNRFPNLVTGVMAKLICMVKVA